MPITPFKLDLKGEYSPKTINRSNESRRHKDSHNLSLHQANRYDQHNHPSNSGNVTKSLTVNKDESDRSVVNKTSDKSNNVTIINSHVQMSSSGLPTTSTGYAQTSQPIISLDHTTVGNEPPPHLVATSRPEVCVSAMSDEMEDWAINTTIVAFVRENDAMSRAKYICNSFKKQYGESWHCVVGTDFFNFANYQENFYIHLTMANQRVIIFKTPAETNCDESIRQHQEANTSTTVDSFPTYNSRNKRNVYNAIESVEQLQVHVGINCDGCREKNIKGLRFKCLQCEDFDLCSTCENNGMHNNHVMARLHKPMVFGSRNRSMFREFCKMSKKYFEENLNDED